MRGVWRGVCSITGSGGQGAHSVGGEEVRGSA